LNNISTQHAVELFWVPGQAGVQGNEIVDELVRGALFWGFMEPSWPWETLDEKYKKV